MLTPETAQVMLCGNPDMLIDMQALLGERGDAQEPQAGAGPRHRREVLVGRSRPL
jgi:hypothetical protein